MSYTHKHEHTHTTTNTITNTKTNTSTHMDLAALLPHAADAWQMEGLLALAHVFVSLA